MRYVFPSGGIPVWIRPSLSFQSLQILTVAPNLITLLEVGRGWFLASRGPHKIQTIRQVVLAEGPPLGELR